MIFVIVRSSFKYLIVLTLFVCLVKQQHAVVQKLDSAIHRINLYPVDSAIGFPNTYPLDSDLSSG